MNVVQDVHPIRQVTQGSDYVQPMFLFDRPPHKLQRPPPDGLNLESDPESVFDWAYANGGIDVGRTILSLIVVGRTTDAVVLTDFRIKVDRDEPEAAGYVVEVRGGGMGGGMDTREIEINLDRPTPKLKLHDTAGRTTPWSFPLKVSSADPEHIEVTVNAGECTCSWTAELHYIVDGRPAIHRIDNNGLPFRIAAQPDVLMKYITRDGLAFEPSRTDE